jgi:hypothetical protein
MKPASLVAITFLGLVSLLHLLRLFLQVGVRVGSLEVPLWISGPAFLLTGGLALWLWRERGA